MLILSRKPDQAIFLNIPPDYAGGEIKITVGDIYGENVRLLVEAPKEVIVDREEVRDKKLAGNAWRPTGKKLTG